MVEHLQGMGDSIVQPLPGSDVSRSSEKIIGAEKRHSFQQILGDQLEKTKGLKFSMHAQERMRIRNIQMSEQDVEILRNAVDQIADKGGSESVVLMSNSAFLVSIKNRTIITAIGGENVRNNVFTNIDSAIVI